MFTVLLIKAKAQTKMIIKMLSTACPFSVGSNTIMAMAITVEIIIVVIKRFSVFLNGCVCGKCFSHAGDAISISQSTLYALQYVVYSDIGKLYTFTVSDEVLTELKMVVGRCVHAYIDYKMNSLEILDTLT